MSEVAPTELKKAVKSQLGRTATFSQSVPVHKQHNGQMVWDGFVATSALMDHPTAKRADVWSYKRPDERRGSPAVPHTGPISSPRDTARAAILAKAKTAK